MPGTQRNRLRGRHTRRGVIREIVKVAPNRYVRNSRSILAGWPRFNPAGAAQYWIRWRDAKRTDYHQGVAYETQPLLKEKCIIYQRNVNSTPSSVSLLSSKYFL